jgi:hypothetical protein
MLRKLGGLNGVEITKTWMTLYKNNPKEHKISARRFIWKTEKKMENTSNVYLKKKRL